MEIFEARIVDGVLSLTFFVDPRLLTDKQIEQIYEIIKKISR